MLSPPVPPRRQPQMNVTPTPALPHTSSSSSLATTPCNGSVNALSQAVAATAAAVTAGITRLERNCWQDYGETQLLQNDSLRSSASSNSNQSNTSSSSSASFVTAASRFSLYQSSPPQQLGCEPPVPAPRLKKEKEVYNNICKTNQKILNLCSNAFLEFIELWTNSELKLNGMKGKKKFK